VPGVWHEQGLYPQIGGRLTKQARSGPRQRRAMQVLHHPIATGVTMLTFAFLITLLLGAFS
jgi:hypothetical protein